MVSLFRFSLTGPRKVSPCFLAVLPDLNGGGAQRVTLNLINTLTVCGLRAGLLCFVDRGVLRASLEPTVEIHTLKTRTLSRSLLPLFLTLRRLQPAVLFSTLGYVNIAILALRILLPRGTRVWVREANLPSLSLPNNKFSCLMRGSYAVLYRKADLVICSSGRMRDELVRKFGVPPERTRVLVNPVNEIAIRQLAFSKPVPVASTRRFVAAGRLTIQKGFDRLLEMFANLRDDGSELVILGEGPIEDPLKQQATELGVSSRVHFEGFTPNPWAWFATSDAFLLPSRWEGMPNVALEALACGLPVIATPESGGIAEVAAVAPPGSVRVAKIGEEFLEAMESVPRRVRCNLSPSLLPSQYHLESVTHTLMSWINEGV